jgi:hypothetical protein
MEAVNDILHHRLRMKARATRSVYATSFACASIDFQPEVTVKINLRRFRTELLASTVCCLAGSLVLYACTDEPTASRSPAVALPASTVGVAATSSGQDAGVGSTISASGALAGKLPSSDTVTSSVPAFEIKQKGGGIAGRFEITNVNSAAIALDGVNAGTGHALLAWNLGRGRGAVIITSNSTNTLPTLDVSAQSSGNAADIRANNSTSTNAAVKATTIGLGRAGDFLVNNANNTNPGLEAATIGLGSAGIFRITNASNTSSALFATTSGSGAALDGSTTGSGAAVQGSTSGGGAGVQGSTSGTGSAGLFAITNTSNTSPALSASTTGTGVALQVNASAASTSLAVFQTAGVNKIRFGIAGKGFFNNGTQMGGADVAEVFDVEGEVRSYSPGDVLVISTRSDRRVEKSRTAYSPLVVGVYATKPGVILTEKDIDASLDGTVPLGVVGVIPTKVSAENGAIRRGDLLVTASLAGHAMRGTKRSRMMGATVGKALEEFSGPGTGIIKVLVNVK